MPSALGPTDRPFVAPAPPGVRPVVLQRCDDGGDGGVLINGICL